MRQYIAVATILAALSVALMATSNAAENRKQHRVAIQVDQDNAGVMNLALNNARNVLQYYAGRGENVEVVIVAYGPGLHMLRADTSPVKDRIKRMVEGSYSGKIVFAACNNTKKGMEKREGHAIPIIPQATIVPSGIVRLMELQEQGWSYVRP
jgi:uncharacterized protein